VKEGAYFFCPADLLCPGQQIGRIIHYASRQALNIQGLNDKTVRQLVEKRLVNNIADLYRLSYDDLLQLEGFAKKSAYKLHQAIQDSKKTKLDRFLYALGIHHLGEHMATVLAWSFRILESLEKASLSELREVSEVGPETASSVRTFFDQKENRKVLRDLVEAGMEIEEMGEAKI
jgi:DNA ligase (NAD+)